MLNKYVHFSSFKNPIFTGEEFVVSKKNIREKFLILWKYIYPCVRNGIWWLVVPHFSLIENKAGLFSLLESLTVTREDLNIRPHQCQLILFLSRIWPRSPNIFPKALIAGLNYTCLYLLLCSFTGTFFTPIFITSLRNLFRETSLSN